MPVEQSPGDTRYDGRSEARSTEPHASLSSSLSAPPVFHPGTRNDELALILYRGLGAALVTHGIISLWHILASLGTVRVEPLSLLVYIG